MLIALSDTPLNERGPSYTRWILAAIHHASTRREPVEFLIGRHAETVGLYCRYPDYLDGLIRQQFHAKYPDCTIESLPADALQMPCGHTAHRLELFLRPDVFPIVRYQQFEDAIQGEVDDPLGGLLQSLTGDLRAELCLQVVPATRRRIATAQSIVHRLSRSALRQKRSLARTYVSLATAQQRWKRTLASLAAFGFTRGDDQRPMPEQDLSESASRMHDRERELQSAASKTGQHLFEVRLTITVYAPNGADDQARQKLRNIEAVLNKFTEPRLSSFERRHGRGPRRRRGWLCSDEELAGLWHLPTKSVKDGSRSATHFRRFEPPVCLPLTKREGERKADGICELGQVAFQDRQDVFGIRAEDRLRHLFLAGKTGNGKSTVLLNAIRSDMNAGHGVSVVDPHGDLADSVLAAVPKERTNDVILIDPADREFPVSLNPFDVDPALIDVACDGVVSTFRKVFGTGMHTPRLEDILWNTVLALMQAGDTTLLDMLRMYGADDRFRHEILSRVTDPVVLHWWQNTFPKLRALKEDPFSSVENKLRQLLTNAVIRNMVSQPSSRVNIRAAIDDGKIIIVNLSKGKLGERTSSFLGSLFVSQLQLAAMGRADIAEERRRPHYLFVDEFHNVATSSFASILSEARKFKLGMCIATQFLEQIDAETLQAVYGNVGSLVIFAVGPNDAEPLAVQLTGDVTAADLIALPKYHAYVRLMVDGMSYPAFSMQTIAPPDVFDPQRSLIVRDQSRRQYAQPVQQIEARVQQQMASV